MPDVDTKGIDFADIGSVVGGLSGLGALVPDDKSKDTISLGSILKMVLNNPQILGVILGLFQGLGGLFKKKAQDPTTPVIPVPITPVPVPVPPTAPSGSKITSLRDKIYFFERTMGGSKVLNKQTYDNLLAGNEFLTRGDRIHLDVTPMLGNIFMGPESSLKDKLLLQDPSKGDVEGNHRIVHVAIVDGHEFRSGDPEPENNWDGQDVVFLTSEYDDYGCTPVMTVNRDLELGSEHTVSYYAEYVSPDGNKVTGNKTPQVTVKPWGN